MRVRFPVVRRKLRFGRSDGLRAFTPSSPSRKDRSYSLYENV